MKAPLHRLTPFLPLALAACATTGSAMPGETPIEGPVGIGQTAYVGGPKVKPLALIEDSRCPADVTCVWAGRVIVRVEVRGGRWRRQLDLTLGQPQHVADGQFTLTSVTPARTTTGKFAPAAYRFGFTFTGGL